MHELTGYQSHQLMQRFPSFELSYETQPHKKVSPDYNICMAIPVGKKCFAWFTFYGNQNVCFFIELNRDKKAGKIMLSSIPVSNELAKGTLLYGTILDNTANSINDVVFLADDIYYYCGTPTKNLLFSEKLAFLYLFFTNFCNSNTDNVLLALPIIWPIYQQNDYNCIFDVGDKTILYVVHHVQYRCLNIAGPFYNVIPNKKLGGPTSFGSTASGIASAFSSTLPIVETKSKIRMDTNKLQYNNPTVFIVTADLAFDVYHLFAYSRNKELVYCDVAYISNYKASVFMNSIFRKIKENDNLDAIEESDDEEDFQNTSYDKYVDLEKKVQMECRYNHRFKKWQPVRKLDGSHKTVHISQLASHY